MTALWTWQYDPKLDEWAIHTPNYDPEISLKARRVKAAEKIFFGYHNDSTMPRAIAELVARQVYDLDLFGKADRGVVELYVDPAPILKVQSNVEIFMRRHKLKTLLKGSHHDSP